MFCYICGEKEGFQRMGALLGAEPLMHAACRRSLESGEPTPALPPSRGTVFGRSEVLREMFSAEAMIAYPTFRDPFLALQEGLREASGVVNAVEPLVAACGGVVRIANGCKVIGGRVVDVRMPRRWLVRMSVAPAASSSATSALVRFRSAASDRSNRWDLPVAVATAWEHGGDVTGLIELYVRDGPLGPADPLGHGRLRHEVGLRDLPRGQAADRAQRERDGRGRGRLGRRPPHHRGRARAGCRAHAGL